MPFTVGVRVEAHQIYDYIYDRIVVTVPAGTTVGTVVDGVKLTPPSNRVWYVQYMRINLPPELEGKFLIDTADTVGKEFPPQYIPPRTDYEEDLTRWTGRGMRLLGINIRVRAVAALTADRTAFIDFNAEVAKRLY